MDWNDMQTWHWFAIIGGSVLVIGIIFYFLPIGKIKIPSVITASFGALGLGLSIGIIFMAGLGYKPFGPESPSGPVDPGTEPKMGGGAPKMGGGMPGGAKGKVGGAPGGPAKGKTGGSAPGGGGPSPRQQLASLVNALDSLSDKPITITLSDQARTDIAAQLKGLDAVTEIKDDEAKSKLEAIQKIVEKDRASLETVGYRWVTDGKSANRPTTAESANPFKEGKDAERLKSLLERLGKK